MKRHHTIALDEVKEAMRRGMGGAVENRGGYCVYVDGDGRRLYVVDEQTKRPVPFRELKGLRSSRIGPSVRVPSPII